MEDPYEVHECYVCYEPCQTLANCKCKTLYVHTSCITIMRLYGKTECGICKEPYPEISRPLELFDTEDDIEYDVLPCCCYIIPTMFRSEYLTSDCDKCMDIFRFLTFITAIFVLWFLFSNYAHRDVLTPFSLSFLSLICCCFVAEQRTRRLQHMQNPHTHREPQLA